MTILTVFLQMLALLVMIAAGVIAAKGKMLDAHTNAKMSTMIVNIFNPLILLPLLRLLPVDDGLAAVCLVMFGMPVGSMPLMLITERGLDGKVCTAAVLMSTILCVVSVPILMSFV